MRHELLAELSELHIELRLVPDLDRTVWRPGVRLLKVRAGLPEAELDAELERALVRCSVSAGNADPVQEPQGGGVETHVGLVDGQEVRGDERA